ncbi:MULTISPECIES: hypothetical protein [Actinosynnema]|uniref:hypothetical protein n=1 Tax=Actinosynnema TaxID=40566 RepID=UPI0020A42A36|nr:hypothetical protein [Actinosynnema pretiosum]MCP2096764.1 hypothetical protein [Actinosynnema pretiosum]
MSAIIMGLAAEDVTLQRLGVTADEYQNALLPAIESIRGRLSASNSQRREFLKSIFREMLAAGVITDLALPEYGDDTVYRLSVKGMGDVAIIQKGCPDGAHSSVRWEVPDWASETYLWWLCPNLKEHPGWHINRGVSRIRQRFLTDRPGDLDGVIFHNETCGTAERVCPKADRSRSINGVSIPPPCVYVMPDRAPSAPDEWNWQGDLTRRFPAVLLSFFGVNAETAPAYTGHVGFQRRAGSTRTAITSRFGPGRLTAHRS